MISIYRFQTVSRIRNVEVYKYILKNTTTLRQLNCSSITNHRFHAFVVNNKECRNSGSGTYGRLGTREKIGSRFVRHLKSSTWHSSPSFKEEFIRFNGVRIQLHSIDGWSEKEFEEELISKYVVCRVDKQFHCFCIAIMCSYKW